MGKEYIGSQEHFEDRVNAHYDQKKQMEQDMENQYQKELSKLQADDYFLLQVKDLFVKLTDEQRIEVIMDYCKYCGSNDNKCNCQNDC
jgi:hypothetical protein